MSVSSLKLLTDRLLFLPLCNSDGRELSHFFRDPDIRFHFFGSEHPPRTLIDRFIRENLNPKEDQACRLWLVHDRRTEALIGFGGLVELPHFPFPELHLAVDRDFRGHGFGKEMAQRLMWYALYQHHFNVVLASVEHTNDPAIHLLLSCGMHLNKIIPWKGSWYHQFAYFQKN